MPGLCVVYGTLEVHTTLYTHLNNNNTNKINKRSYINIKWNVKLCAFARRHASLVWRNMEQTHTEKVLSHRENQNRN